MKGMWSTIAIILAITLFLAITSSTMLGQAVNATLLGTVTDTSGAVISGAKVLITETATGVGRTTSTNESGNYEFANLPPGQYEITVEQQGFKKAARKDVDVVVNSAVRVNLTLQPGTASETVEVTSA